MEREFNYGEAGDYDRIMGNLVGLWEAEEDYNRYVSLYYGDPEGDNGEDRYQVLATTDDGTALWMIDFRHDTDVEEIKRVVTEVLSDSNPLEDIEYASKELEGRFANIDGFIEFMMLDMELAE